MNRDIAREIAVQMVYGAPASGTGVDEFMDEFLSPEHFASLADVEELYSEQPKGGMLRYIRDTVSGVFEHVDEINELIENNSRGWRVERLSSTARAVLRVAIYEMLYAEDVPVASAINSAVEIDKGYDEAEVVSFINGVLGSVAKELDSRSSENRQ